MINVDQVTAHKIIQDVAGFGQPPEYGFQFFSVGLEEITSVIEHEYLDFSIKHGGSSFKAVIGGYGSGKTHFLYTIRELAWNKHYVTSHVTLTPEETPFHKLEAVYRAVVNNIQPPLTPEEILSGSEVGIEAFIIRWFNTVIDMHKKLGFKDQELNKAVEEWLNNNIKSFESISFTRAIKNAFLTLLNNQMDDFQHILIWLKGENYTRKIHSEYGIMQKVDKETAFQRLRSLGQWMRQIGFNGLVIMFDEAEQTPSFSSKQIAVHLNNLRQLIDACQRTSFRGFMFFYAIPDEEFLNQRGQVYVALQQRMATYLTVINPSGVKINLETLFGRNDEAKMDQNLFQVGKKLYDLYSIAYQLNFDESDVSSTLNNMIKAAKDYSYYEVGILRLFVQRIIQAYHIMRSRGGTAVTLEEAQEIFQ